MNIKKNSFMFYPEITDADFNKNIYLKKEFRDTEIKEKKVEYKKSDFTLEAHQIFLKNYISPDTPYNGILIYHGTGVGKTCSAISIAEGFKKTLKDFNLSLSYAIMYQYVDYQLTTDTKIIRNSFRVKLGFIKNKFKFTNEYYYQPNFTMLSDYIIYGNSKILLLPLNKISYTLQGNVNYRSKSKIKNIDNITFGITYTFKHTKYIK